MRRQGFPRGVLVGSAFVASAIASGGVLLYYLSLPHHAGPENSSPPPEALGLAYGAALACIVSVAVVAVAQRSLLRAAASFTVAFAVGVLAWLAAGSGTLSDRLGDCLLGILVLGPAAVAGVALGAVVIRIREYAHARSRARPPRSGSAGF